MSRLLFTIATICAGIVCVSSSASAFDGFYGTPRVQSSYSQRAPAYYHQSNYTPYSSGYAVQGQFGAQRYAPRAAFRQPVYQQNFRGQRGHVHRQYHDTTHYDFHPATVVRHRNHLHVQPAHYDLHRTGHFDSYRH